MIRRDRQVEQDFAASGEGDEALAVHLRRNPIEAWIGGKGTGGTRFFSYSDGFFKSELDVPEPLVEPTQELIREIVNGALQNTSSGRHRTPLASSY